MGKCGQTEPQGLTRLSRTSFHLIIHSRVIIKGNHQGIPSPPKPWLPNHVHLIIANTWLPQDSRPTIQKHESKIWDIPPSGNNLSNGMNNCFMDHLSKPQTYIKEKELPNLSKLWTLYSKVFSDFIQHQWIILQTYTRLKQICPLL